MEIQYGDQPLNRLIEFIEIMERSYPSSDNRDKRSIMRILFHSLLQRDTGTTPTSPFTIKPMNSIEAKDIKIHLNGPSKKSMSKTLLHIWMSGVKLNKPCFILDKYAGEKNMASATFVLNKILKTTARMIGVDPTSVPYLVIYDSQNDEDRQRFDKGLKAGFGRHVPLCYFVGDKSGIERMRKMVMDNRPIGLEVNIGKKRGLDTGGVSEMKIQKFRRIHEEQSQKRRNILEDGKIMWGYCTR